MEKIFKRALVLTSLSLASLSAQDCCAPCEHCCEEVFFVTDCQYFIDMEFLYWKTETSPLDYALFMNKSAETSTIFAYGKYKTADYDYRPGYRVSLAWYNAPDYWEVEAAYTWLYDKGANSTNDPTEADLFLNPVWNTITTPPFQRASSLIDLHYHVGDLTAARVFDPNPHLRMRLLGGITLSYITQSWKVRYSDFNKNFDRIKNKWRFFGGGLRIGVTADWFWGCQFYLTGRSSFATLVGTYKNEAIQRLQNGIIVRDSTYNDHRLTFHSQILLGPSWQQVCECWSAEVFAGYELNIWLNLNEIYRSGPASAPEQPKPTSQQNGDFGLHGLTARFTIGF